MKLLSDKFISRLSIEEAEKLIDKMRREIVNDKDTRKKCIKLGNILGLELFIKKSA